MGVLRDLLEKVGIKDFNIVKYEKNVEREQIVKQKVVLKNVSVSANLPAIAADDRVIRKADELLTPGIGFVRNDLIYAESGMLTQKKEQHAIMQELRDCIEARHFRAMIAAYAIINYEDIGDWELAYSMLEDLVKLHGEQGRHIYNLCRSGYIEGYFLHYLQIMKFESGKGGEYKQRFRQFFSKAVTFFDLAIWSNDLMTPGAIHYGLKKRMKEFGITAVKVYGRGDANIEKVRKGCATYLEEDKEAMLESEERYRICNSPCCCMTMMKATAQTKSRREGLRRRGSPSGGA